MQGSKSVATVVEPMNLQPPMPTRAFKDAIWKHAEGIRHDLKITSGFDLLGLIEANGGSVNYIGPFSEDQTDAIVVRPDDTFEITLSSLTGPLRDNFTLAHELGHYILHWPVVRGAHPGDGMRATRAVDPDKPDLVRCEWEANWFASAFLMPEEAFRSAYASGGAEGSAASFGVSPAAAAVRAKTLVL